MSPLTLRAKSTPGKFRLIHNLSAPYDSTSINDNIPDTNKTVHYVEMKTIIQAIHSIGRGAFIAKSDVKSAFRLVPVHPADYHLLGFVLENKYYFDRCLTMGCGSSCRIFEGIATSVNWILQNKFGLPFIFHYLDDFCILGEDYASCKRDLDTFKAICKRLGLILAEE